MLMDDITEVGWPHKYRKSYRSFTQPGVYIIRINEGSIGSTTSFFHISMVVHPGSDNHLYIWKFVHKALLSSLSKKQQNGKVLLNNVALGFNYKLSIHMLMKQLYIAVRYFYIPNQLTLEENY